MATGNTLVVMAGGFLQKDHSFKQKEHMIETLTWLDRNSSGSNTAIYTSDHPETVPSIYNSQEISGGMTLSKQPRNSNAFSIHGYHATSNQPTLRTLN